MTYLFKLYDSKDELNVTEVVDRAWSKGHNWDSALISTAIERIEDASKKRVGQTRQAEVSGVSPHPAFTRHLGLPRVLEGHSRNKEKEDVEMNPCDLCPFMFKQWYQQDGKKIMATTNNINAMKGLVMAHLLQII